LLGPAIPSSQPSIDIFPVYLALPPALFHSPSCTFAWSDLSNLFCTSDALRGLLQRILQVWAMQLLLPMPMHFVNLSDTICYRASS
jgi:hypothetical protein